MKKFEVLCVTMHQNDTHLFQDMRLDSDVVFANQGDEWKEISEVINGHMVRMYTTTTRGVGKNRNIALLNADAQICLLADDDMTYRPDYEKKILEEFQNHPKADVIIFNIGTTTPEFGRIPTKITKFKRFTSLSRNPYGGPRVAFRLESIRKANVYFSTLLGGGAPFKRGEDTVWIQNLLRAGLKIYLSPCYIGDVSYATTTSFSADVKQRLYDYGAMMACAKTRLWPAYFVYSLLREKRDHISKRESWKWMCEGRKGFALSRTYQQYLQGIGKE